MSRRKARELVFHLIFENDFLKSDASGLVSRALDEEYFKTLNGESDVYDRKPSEQQMEYIRQAVSGVYEKAEELDGYIAKYSVGWNLSRISKVSKSVLRLCMLEMKYLGIPVGASVNEAIELVKKYDEEDAAPFVNGVLASFIKNELPANE